MAKPANHNTRTKKWLLDNYPTVTSMEVTEHWNAFSHKRNDLFGFIDLLVLLVDETWGIQVTSRSNHAKRRNKILDSERAFNWTKAGNRIFVISWVKKKNRWEAKKEEITNEDIRLSLFGT